MRGPQQESVTYPGGKAAYRLLQLLESSGQTQAVAALIAAVMANGDRDEFVSVASQYSAAPAPEAAAATVIGQPSAGFDLSEEYLAVGQQMATAGPGAGPTPQWSPLGPLTIPNGQTYGASRVNVSGRVAAIAIDPNNAAHVLVGAANGGVWESKDRGASWAPRTDYAPTTTVGAIAFDPSHPSTVYCGTGEGNWWMYLGAGVLRSADGGTTWSQLCTAPFVGQGFFALVVDPANGSHLLAGTTSGLYVSTDSGITWTQRRSAATWAISMALTGGASAEILAACGDGVFRSTDGGTSWTAVALTGAPAAFNRLSVAIAPSDPTVAYAWGAQGTNAFLWRRSGGTWSTVAPPNGVSTTQAWYDWFLAVSPDDPGQIYLGAIDAYHGTLSGATWNWLDISTKGAGQDSIHPDQHAIAFEPHNPNTIYVGCDGGLFRSDNRGVNWTHCNNGLVISEFEYLAQRNADAHWLIGGTQDNGTARWTGSGVWQHIADGDGGDCGVNQTVPTTDFHTYYGMSPERSASSGDFGTWNGIAPTVPAGENALFYPPFECAPNGNTIALGGGRLYVSRDQGNNWTPLAYPNGGTASALAIPNVDNVYVGLTDGRIFHTAWSGSAWGALTALATPRAGAYVSDMAVDSNNLHRIWATSRTIGGGRVFRSDDGGSTWLDRTAGLPGLPINAIAVDPANANRLWVAADLGVYESNDAGATWHNYNNGLPNAYIGDLVFHPQARRLRAGTRNRGVWEVQVDAPPLAGRPRTPINVVARYPEHLDVFAVANDGRTMSDWWDASNGWGGWFQLSGGIASPGGAGSPITAINRYSGHLDVFTVGTDNHAYSAWWDASSGWSEWFRLGTLQCRPGATITVVARYNDHLDLFTTASDGRIMSIWWDARTGWAADWFQVSQGVAAPGTTVTAVARYSFHLDLFTVGTDNRVYSCWWDDRTGWAGWFALPGITCRPDSTVTVVARYPDHLDLFTTASSGAIMSTWWDARSGWGTWFQVSGGVASPGSPVTAIARYSNHLDLFTTGADNHIYSTWWHDTTGWAGWFNVSGGVGEPGGQTAAISRITEHIDLFTVGADGLIYSSWWDATTGWAAWFQLSG